MSIEDAIFEARDVSPTDVSQESSNGQNSGQITMDKDDLMLILMAIQVVLLLQIAQQNGRL